MASTLRVRQILDSLNVIQTAQLKKLLPSKLSVPTVETASYPSAVLRYLPEKERYAILGCCAEELLRLSVASITVDALVASIKRLFPSWSAEGEALVRKSKTTDPFLDNLRTTRTEIEKVLRTGDGTLKYEVEVVYQTVAGHPDMYNTTQVFEMKLTGMLKQNWQSFLYQVFAYGALMPEVKDLYLVLPLQRMVWHCDIRGWAKRNEYRDFLVKCSTTSQTTGFENHFKAALLCMTFGIGNHMGKQKTIAQTIQGIPDYGRPYQIFLGGAQNSKCNIADSDLAAANSLVQKTGAKVFVHSQYIINLCVKGEDNWNVNLLIKNLQYTRAFGGKGVVVHVGKSVKLPLAEALEQMRAAITECLPHASKECPLLLETPAGQGTETLTDQKEFLDFVDGFHDERLRICLDTCHVFACGHDPLAYIDAALARPGLLKLVHYNDSHGACGSCVDRHAHIGEGEIGFEKMAKVAQRCSEQDLPMIIE